MNARTLAAVTRATERRQNADHAYRAAIVTARADGHTLAAIARAAGLTRQGVDYLLKNPTQERTT